MNENPGILRSTCNAVGAIPVALVDTLVPSETVHDYIDNNRNRVREVVGGACLLGVGLWALG